MPEKIFKPEPGIAGTYIDTIVDEESGLLEDIRFHDIDRFNFAYDVVDRLGSEQPDRLAMLHVDREGKERRFTFADMKKYSSMTANYFRFLGIKKGDRVLLVLKRHYQFWFSILALHKIGAIAIPATFLLVKKDWCGTDDWLFL